MSLFNALKTRNVGKIDRLIRSLPTLIVVYLHFTGAISGGVSVFLGVLALMLLLTSLTGTCSIYYFLGLSTCPRKKPKGFE
ncbi:DUF2892 domain-containing protein [Nodosilinea sp. LEGE 07088]|uniref:YgaP family membrane protein n=1 Tax=Nodosilinea sp. LEGE 07088 TaxID=2777968 RepID=UPI0018802FD7|nr:DUF2892 domain-containing protein [Nodosilinea sp. LEGE 07088]MBE9141029.1 DUF2892 domain-containing protein [Nodosilinea sp. LEGE 07088]